jgi:DNA-binding MarR family transcriptional regulator
MKKNNEKVLLALCRNFDLGLTLAELSKETGLEEKRIKPIVDELETRGFLEGQLSENEETLYVLENEGIKFCLSQKKEKLSR